MRLLHIICLQLVLAVAAGPALADARDDREAPLRIVVGVPAGAVSDLVARLLAEKLQASLARTVIVESRVGASGRIAVEALKQATPDGATLLLVPIIVPVIGPLTLKGLNYDPARDLAPVSQVTKYELAFAVAGDHPARSVAAFVAWAKANPRRANFGTPGAGSLPHFLGDALARASGVELLHVPYQGVGQLEVDLIGGEIASGIAALSDLAALHREGRIRILATSGVARSTLLSAVPTFREQGYPTVEAAGWHAVYAPAGTPARSIARLSAAIVAALATPDVRARLIAMGLEPTGTSPEQLAAIMAADKAYWAPIIKAAGFSAD